MIGLILIGLATAVLVSHVRQSALPRFQVLDTGVACWSTTPCTLRARLKNNGGTGNVQVQLTASWRVIQMVPNEDNRSGPCTAANPGWYFCPSTARTNCVAVSPRTKPGEIVDASCTITSGPPLPNPDRLTIDAQLLK